MRNWLLPEYTEDVLPAEAARMEKKESELFRILKKEGLLNPAGS